MKYYTVHHGASFYADQLGLSLPHLFNDQKAAGNTPLEVIASVILMDAKSRLKSGNEPVKNIALSLGFNNISFFNKFSSNIPVSLRMNIEDISPPIVFRMAE